MGENCSILYAIDEITFFSKAKRLPTCHAILEFRAGLYPRGNINLQRLKLTKLEEKNGPLTVTKVSFLFIIFFLQPKSNSL